MEDPVVPLEKNLYGYLLAGLSWERQVEKSLVEDGWEKFFNWEYLFVNRGRGLSLSVYVDDIKLTGKTEKHRTGLGKFSWKTLIWENQHHFLTKKF